VGFARHQKSRLALDRNAPRFGRLQLGQVPLENAVRDADLSIPARWAYIIPSGMHAALSSSRGHHPGTDDATMPLKGGAYGHERTHDRDPR
jgi:hypothetical protein